MNTSIRVKTNVMPGNKIEIISNQLHPGEEVEVYIKLTKLYQTKKISISKLLKETPAPGLFKSTQEIDQYVSEERNSWER